MKPISPAKFSPPFFVFFKLKVSFGFYSIAFNLVYLVYFNTVTTYMDL